MIATIYRERSALDYVKEFFDLQLRFAEKAAQLTGQPLSQTIANYTAYYVMFNLGTHLDWEHPVWKDYVVGIKRVDNIGEWTYQVYQLQQGKEPVSEQQKLWGCFGYDYHQGDRRIIRLHFNNRDESGEGPLSHQRQFARMAELSALFLDVKNTSPEAELVRGETWLYNRPQYTRLFPPKYSESPQVIEPGFQYRAIWGQFVKSDGHLQESLAASFLQKLAHQEDIQHLDECFPFQILRVECEIEAFYTFYSI
jgi:hypothetical protein